MTGWAEVPPPVPPRPGLRGIVRAVARLLLVAIVIYGLLPVLLIARLFEWLTRRWRTGRRLSPRIVQLASRISLRIMGIRLHRHGRPMRHPGAIVSNHASWLDIFVLSAATPAHFVSKAEVGKWPVVGHIARAAGTVFIERRSSHARRQKAQFAEHLLAGDRLLFFPEGTSTDSRRVVRFKSTLFAAFFEPDLAARLWIQPACVIYHAPPGRDARYFGWWGEMEFAPHFLMVLTEPRRARVEVVFIDPVRVSDFPDRKALALHCERAVREVFERRRP